MELRHAHRLLAGGTVATAARPDSYSTRSRRGRTERDAHAALGSRLWLRALGSSAEVESREPKPSLIRHVRREHPPVGQPLPDVKVEAARLRPAAGGLGVGAVGEPEVTGPRRLGMRRLQREPQRARTA